jgi:hypothetical protein
MSFLLFFFFPGNIILLCKSTIHNLVEIFKLLLIEYCGYDNLNVNLLWYPYRSVKIILNYSTQRDLYYYA